MEDGAELNTGTPDVDRVQELFAGLNSAMVVFAAMELEIFDIAAKPRGPVSAKGIAVEKNYDEDQTVRLLNALVSLNLMERFKHEDGTDMYQNSGAGRLLAHCEPDNLVEVAKRVETRFSDALRNKLPREVRTGALKQAQFPAHITVHTPYVNPNEPKRSPRKRSISESAKETSGRARTSSESKEKVAKPSAPEAEKPEEDSEENKTANLYATYVGMNNNLAPHVKSIVEAFDFSIHPTAVDLGGGAGVLSFGFCERYPEMQVTLFEVEPVISMVKERFLPLVEDSCPNLHLRTGDFMDEHKLPSADLYILSQIIHDWRSDQADFILDKVYKALLPGGGILLLEQCLAEDRCGPGWAAVRDVLVMSSCGGGLRTASEFRALLTKHKFKDVKVVRTQVHCMYDIIYARKE